MEAKSTTQGVPQPCGRTSIWRNTSPLRFEDSKGEATPGKVPGEVKKHNILSFIFFSPDSSDFITLFPMP